MRLTEHRPDAAHLEHQPLQGFVLAALGRRQKPAGLARQVEKNRARLEKRHRFAVRPIGIDDGRDFRIWVDGHKFGGQLLALCDVDGFHAQNIGALAQGKPRFIPCTPYGVMKMLASINTPLAGAEAVIVGRSNIVGKPMALLLLAQGCTVTICHSQTRDLALHTRRADILIAAVGRPKMMTGEMIKPGAIVIDVGINRLPDGKLCGDIDFASAREVCAAITPVPGGVGPMTITMLLTNTLEAAERSAL